ncbi:Pectin lyase fold protein [Moelleriella libera RCEF 2490]|uniref:Pectin lyase fold protein n=1 Tax=Moelleriella libera RCEF 2490 TaxID=1081109 RepID=A0A166PXK2_9HYPO|nr:Pectin lyase fold protein [Moelleriella libera RCEF 2490]
MRLLLVLATLAALSTAHDISHRGLAHADILATRDVPSEESMAEQAKAQGRQLCTIKPKDNEEEDDGPQIMDALNDKCRNNSLVFLPGPTYNIRTNMTTLKMDDVQIMLYGRMLWSKDIAYWTSVSMPIGFQNQSTVWYFGGDKVTWDGFNTGTLDGNGQVWYDWAKSEGNVARRPMAINFRNLTNSVIKRMRFVQSQMWTMAITYSKNVELDDIYVNSTSTSRWNTLNTDGCDTVNSDGITFRRWFVVNGDDSIALKGNSTNIAIYDSEFHDGQGVAIGSMGQYVGRHEYITNFYARNITLVNTAHVSYLKTWAGTSRGYPPNGGGGGLGHATNITMEDITVERLREPPFFAWQCENYSGFAGKDCNSSKFKMNQIAWRRVSGTVDRRVKLVGSFQCSLAAGGCDDIEATDIKITTDGDHVLNTWRCENVHGAKGFVCDAPARGSGSSRPTAFFSF